MSSVILEIDAAPKFAFLALPPPPKKKRAAVSNTFRAPVSPVNRSNTILAWAETVHPGSPAPMTPASGVSLPRSASFVSSPRLQAFRRSSLTRTGSRRQSISSTRSRIPSASFLHFADTPRTPVRPIPATPLPADVKFDFAAFGYASIFVDVPVSTPITPDIYKPKPMACLPSRHEAVTSSAPTTPVIKSTGMFKRLLGNKPKTTKPQAKGQSKAEKASVNPIVSDYVSVSLKKRSKYTEQSPSGVEKKKREAYAAALPPTVKQEAQMRQAIEGGSLEYNIQKVMEEKAKREGTAVKINSAEGTKVVEGVETVHRDAQGGIWWDQEEGWEFAHLLASKVPISARCVDSEGWVAFDNLKLKKEDERDDFTDFSSLPSSKCTDLHHLRPLLALDDSIEQLVRGRTKRSSSVVGPIIIPSPSTKSSNIILAIPSRPTRTKHLLQPVFLKDVVAVPPTPSTTSAYSQASSHPRSPGRVTRFVVGGNSMSGSVKRQRSRSRGFPRKQRKPAPPPLKIVPLGPATKLAVNVEPEDDGRKLFLEDSFKPDHVTMDSRWSRDTAAVSRPPLTKSSDSNGSVNHFALVSVPKKSRGLGGLFKKERK
ncbi:hypothetical protein BDM02DRAFT_3003956 [Thelephora ganbajun]|uniref:Uncharacterized protein n=1 Tax=Thelephora ganbajun TaxID=370292 RepID=A0ACB6ZA40_THEGA|nr:hypothetical protein BDM02DRAFT_3003956 [Thelephora ganbajun]